jgi:hypothetical protein
MIVTTIAAWPGTFRIAGEEDESKQPMFNLAAISCEKQPDDMGAGLECKVTKAVVWAQSGKPDPDNPNCSSISTLQHIQ